MFPIHCLSAQDPQFPTVLKHLSDPPSHIYFQGNLSYSFEKSLAVVGTRTCSETAKQICNTLIKTVCPHLYIISGLAYGIDAQAATTALQYGGKTMAILGSGLERLYPKEHATLAKRILETGGCILSEYPPYQRPEKYRFVARNRLIAALSHKTLVIQAPLKSGSLITADFATQLGRDVCAVPGDPDKPECAGSNRLIQQGAHVILSGKDILSLYGITI